MTNAIVRQYSNSEEYYIQVGSDYKTLPIGDIYPINKDSLQELVTFTKEFLEASKDLRVMSRTYYDNFMAFLDTIVYHKEILEMGTDKAPLNQLSPSEVKDMKEILDNFHRTLEGLRNSYSNKLYETNLARLIKQSDSETRHPRIKYSKLFKEEVAKGVLESYRQAKKEMEENEDVEAYKLGTFQFRGAWNTKYEMDNLFNRPNYVFAFDGVYDLDYLGGQNNEGMWTKKGKDLTFTVSIDVGYRMFTKRMGTTKSYTHVIKDGYTRLEEAKAECERQYEEVKAKKRNNLFKTYAPMEQKLRNYAYTLNRGIGALEEIATQVLVYIMREETCKLTGSIEDNLSRYVFQQSRRREKVQEEFSKLIKFANNVSYRYNETKPKGYQRYMYFEEDTLNQKVAV